MKKNAIKVAAVTALIGSIVFAGSSQALAERGGARPRPIHYQHFYHGRVATLSGLIAGAVIYAGSRYYFYRGYFYEKLPYGYVIVPAPAGAVITALPAGHRAVVVNKTKYYYYNRTYYTRVKQGYIVVDSPIRGIITPAVPQEAVTPAEPDSSAYTVNIVNSDATYTAVVLKGYKDGFMGPQGEWYPVFPSVKQLRVMYGE
ncbi:MAG: DUF6515 family protein [Candidatus Omnitrophota bacterium]